MPMIDAYADSTLFPKESPKALARSDERRTPRRRRDAPRGPFICETLRPF